MESRKAIQPSELSHQLLYVRFIMKANVKSESVIGSAVQSLTKSLSAKSRSKASADEVAAKLGVLMAETGEAIGMRDVDQVIGKEETIVVVKNALDRMIELGLTCDKDCATGDMLKAPSQSNPGELWTIFVDAINAPRMGAGLEEIAKGTRDNYLSRIREYVRGRGAQPLDLYGNLKAAALKAAKTAAQAKKAAQVSEGGDEGEKPLVGASDAPAHTESLKGVAPLVAFLSKYLKENVKGEVEPPFLNVLAMCEDVLDEAQDVFKAESQRKAKCK
jgi:hypothetical protein